MGIDELKKLGRNALISLAVECLNEPLFHSEEYDRVRVMTNNTRLYVAFERSVCYLPVGSSYYRSVCMDLLRGQSWSSVESNFSPVDKETDYYIHTNSHEAVVHHIFKAINASYEVGSVADGKIDKGTVMIIKEHSGYYAVEVVSEGIESFYKVKKDSLELYDTGHYHLVSAEPLRLEENPLYELM